jgi:hypothetical protein
MYYDAKQIRVKRAPRGLILADRITRRVAIDPSSGCWLWCGSIAPSGYGQLGINKVMQYAHRLAYEQFRGPIPEGLDLDHLCRVRHCINPDHLEPVTRAENNRRAALYRTRPTTCPKGHPYNEENTSKRADGLRKCLTCRRKAGNERYARDKEAILARQHARIEKQKKEKN